MAAERQQQLHELAQRQHGSWTLGQALDCGFSRPAVRRRLASGHWQEIDTRVYCVFLQSRPDDRQTLHARVLASAGLAFGRSSAALYGWMPFPPSPEVTVVRANRRNSHRGVHVTDSLPAADRRVVDGIPATAPVRTLIDLGGVLRRDHFEDLFDAVLATGAVRLGALETRARELWAPRRAGCAVVLRLVEETHPDVRRARNGWEAKVLRIVSRLGMPPPHVNHRVRVGGRTRYIDLAWPERMLAVELDGFVAHSNRRVFDDDRLRQNDLVAAGWETYRVTWTAIAADPARAFRHVIAALARERA
jgi:very-short-patch-repair endonuclease